ncbi:hypothetical protein C1752_00408 [Acaryochloris thomasi RCC1774]|uniref:Uncharacterized protein n=1 Tax=Acaryochloris thomasi RCC1774 TaxID=1764569 RepID=A0A2W1JPV3_9CYAN|nr:hypothetical protein [Acaryochloris thomasi]PZD75353.1 hypothetical protein C1752_00408 [Acaryochloris thomasi RCC1774]
MRTLNTACWITLLLTSASPGLAQPVASLVGIQYKQIHEVGQDIRTAVFIGLPEGLTNEGGFLVGDALAEQPYSVSIFKQGNRKIWLFEQILSRNNSQQTRQVFDAVETASDVSLLVGCELNSRQDLELFALIDSSSEQPSSQWITQFSHAWRANRKTKNLEAIQPEGMRCPDPTWGV